MSPTMLRPKTLDLAGWGNFPVQPAAAYRPERNREAIEALTRAPEGSIISRGLGRSYGDACLNDGGAVILHTRLNRFLHFDPGSALLTAEAGVSLEDILNTFVPRGFFLPVTPGTKFVTLGGAIAADVHGKNHHKDGSIGNFITRIALCLADGRQVECSPTDNPDLFWATIGGMGLTGIILRATLRLIPISTAYISVDYKRAANLDEALGSFSAGDEAYQYSVAWIDCLKSGASLGRSVLIRGNHAKVEDLPEDLRANPLTFKKKRRKSIPFNMPSFVLNSWSVKAFNALFYKRHKDKHTLVDYDTFFYPLDGVLHWNRMYGRRGFVQYQALFPHDTARAGLVELLEALSASKRASFLAVLKTMGKPNPGLLSFPFEGQTLALDIPNTGPDLLDFLQQLDQIVLKHNGRIYLAKDARMSPDTVAKMYPQLPNFRSFKSTIDPANRLQSSQSRRLNLAGAP